MWHEGHPMSEDLAVTNEPAGYRRRRLACDNIGRQLQLMDLVVVHRDGTRTALDPSLYASCR